ncbi:YeeE/YedE family protein [Methylopila turkensis]|uniref:Membrane protein n=1 Tax=Methylopila turkensis TaxID=1437816 RepID=A0A9W6JL76_9HYPH|nr:YeeE/YedE family protein [Methylopila turkensis]GLK79217.1 membrane protein [Methylopila turkensis]
MTPPSLDADHFSPTRIALAAVVLAGVAAWAYVLGQTPGAVGARQSFALLAGAAFGIALQRGRFCFLCNLRDLLREGDPRGVLAILVALAAGAVGYAAVFGAWLPNPFGGRLPPTAHVGPVGPALGLAAFVFGVGMAVSGSCLSAHLYRLGEGSPTSPFALAGAVGGFVIGFLTWNPIYLASVAEAPAVWLPALIGYPGWLALTLLVLGLLAALALARGRPGAAEPREPLTLRSAARAVFVERWPFLPSGLLVGAIATLAYLRVAPLGVTAELGSAARTAAGLAGLLPATLHGLDGLRGCATAVKETLLSENGLFVVGLVLTSFAAALVAGRFRPAVPTGAQVARGLIGGLLMGWGAMTALGCTVGVLLSGVHAGAVSGWAFLVFVTLGVVVTDAVGARLRPAA